MESLLNRKDLLKIAGGRDRDALFNGRISGSATPRDFTVSHHAHLGREFRGPNEDAARC
jgi:hypothetical protein